MNDADISMPRGEVIMSIPGSKTGFPMQHHYWERLKSKIQSLNRESSFWKSFSWKDFGMLFLGIALTTFVSYWLPGYSNPNHRIIAISVAIVAFLIGASFIFFQYQLVNKEEEKINSTVSHIIEIMDIIDADYSGNGNK